MYVIEFSSKCRFIKKKFRIHTFILSNMKKKTIEDYAILNLHK